MARKSTPPSSSRRPRSPARRRRVRKLPKKTDLSWIASLHQLWCGQLEPALQLSA